MNETKMTIEGRRREEGLSILGVVELLLSTVALFLAAVALLCWSAAILLRAVMNGPSFDIACTSAAAEVVSPAMAVMIIAISDIRIRHLSTLIPNCNRTDFMK